MYFSFSGILQREYKDNSRTRKIPYKNRLKLRKRKSKGEELHYKGLSPSTH